jgi:hypothetical protein
MKGEFAVRNDSSSGMAVNHGRLVFHPFKVAARVRIPLGLLSDLEPKRLYLQGFWSDSG